MSQMTFNLHFAYLEIDKMVYELYGLIREEITIIENS